MRHILSIIVAIPLLLVAIYAQLRIGAHTRGTGKVWATRVLLLLVAIGFGSVISASAVDESQHIFVLLAGVGLVHVPAAIILFIKGRRGSGKS